MYRAPKIERYGRRNRQSTSSNKTTVRDESSDRPLPAYSAALSEVDPVDTIDSHIVDEKGTPVEDLPEARVKLRSEYHSRYDSPDLGLKFTLNGALNRNTRRFTELLNLFSQVKNNALTLLGKAPRDLSNKMTNFFIKMDQNNLPLGPSAKSVATIIADEYFYDLPGHEREEKIEQFAKTHLNRFKEFITSGRIKDTIKELINPSRSIKDELKKLDTIINRRFGDLYAASEVIAKKRLFEQGIYPPPANAPREVIEEYMAQVDAARDLPASGESAVDADQVLQEIDRLIRRYEGVLAEHLENLNDAHIQDLIAARMVIPNSYLVMDLEGAFKEHHELITGLAPFLPLILAGADITGTPEMKNDALERIRPLLRQGVIIAQAQVDPEVYTFQGTQLPAFLKVKDEINKTLHSLASSIGPDGTPIRDSSGADLTYDDLLLDPSEVREHPALLKQESQILLNKKVSSLLHRDDRILDTFKQSLKDDLYLALEKKTRDLLKTGSVVDSTHPLSDLFIPLPRNSRTNAHYEKLDAFVKDLKNVLSTAQEATYAKGRYSSLESYTDLAKELFEQDSGFDESVYRPELLEKSSIGKLKNYYQNKASKTNVVFEKNPLELLPNARERLQELIDERKQLTGG